MQFVLVKKPAVQIKSTSTGELTRSELLVLAFLRSKAMQGEVETSFSEMEKILNMSPSTIQNVIRALLTARVIARLN